MNTKRKRQEEVAERLATEPVPKRRKSNKVEVDDLLYCRRGAQICVGVVIEIEDSGEVVSMWDDGDIYNLSEADAASAASLVSD